MLRIVRRERLLPLEAGVPLAQPRVGLAVRGPELLEPGVVPTDDRLHWRRSGRGALRELGREAAADRVPLLPVFLPIGLREFLHVLLGLEPGLVVDSEPVLDVL